MTHRYDNAPERPLRIAVFPGSFNPFTIGHKSIVERGLAIFDRIIIAIGCNVNKPIGEDVVERVKEIEQQFRDNDAVSVRTYSGLTADFVKGTGSCAILRGVRNFTDFEYERNLADVNKKLLGVETVFLTALPEYAYVSSSVVRELKAFGHDTRSLLGNEE